MHLILVGACYVDTILSVPHFPGEDDKLSASSVQVRRGGNCFNAVEVLQQLRRRDDDEELQLHLVASLPDQASPAAAMIAASLGTTLPPTPTSLLATSLLATSLFRTGHSRPASCYVLQSAATGSRTIVSHSDLPDMTADEFEGVTAAYQADWWHFEGRLPATVLACIGHVRHVSSFDKSIVSVEVEKPRRDGLRALAAAADVVFYARSWAEAEGYGTAGACLQGEAAAAAAGMDAGAGKVLFCTWGASGASAWHDGTVVSAPAPSVPTAQIVDAVGAGDTFTAGIFYKLSRWPRPWATSQVLEALEFAVALASRKIQQDGFRGLYS